MNKKKILDKKLSLIVIRIFNQKIFSKTLTFISDVILLRCSKGTKQLKGGFVLCTVIGFM